MAVDMFLKIDGIEGESADSKHKGEIEVLSFSWGISNASPTQSPGRLSARKTTLSDFSIVKYVDSASPKLFAGCCTGEHVPELNFAVRKAGETQLEYYKIKLTDVLISSVAPAGSAGGGNTMEQVSFSFGAAEIYAAQQDPRGGIGSTSTAVCGGSSEPADVIIGKGR